MEAHRTDGLSHAHRVESTKIKCAGLPDVVKGRRLLQMNFTWLSPITTPHKAGITPRVNARPARVPSLTVKAEDKAEESSDRSLATVVPV